MTNFKALIGETVSWHILAPWSCSGCSAVWSNSQGCGSSLEFRKWPIETPQNCQVGWGGMSFLAKTETKLFLSRVLFDFEIFYDILI